MTSLLSIAPVNTITRTIDYVSGHVSNTLGIPSWLLETMSECGHRALASGSPSWLVKLVEINRKVWADVPQAVTGVHMGVSMCRMAKFYGEVEALRPIVEKTLFGRDVVSRSSVGVYEQIVDTMIRWDTWSAYCIGYKPTIADKARNRTAEVNQSLVYLKAV
jgi:hypothetical protein